MSEQDIKGIIFIFLSLVASFSLVQYVLPDLHELIKLTIIVIVSFSAFLISEKLFPTGQTKAEHIKKGIIPVTSYMIALYTSKLIDWMYARSNYDFFANVEKYGIDQYNLQLLISAVMTFFIFIIIHRILLKLYSHFADN